VKRPRLLNDDKTFVLLCTARAGRTYTVSLNSAATGGFANLGEHRADPVVLTFSTTRDEPIRNLAEAMKVAKLTGLDVPVAESP
jgi:3-hydroxyisobutyrate dehydrogenase-like beta-hydroxyacid dehydrogenase